MATCRAIKAGVKEEEGCRRFFFHITVSKLAGDTDRQVQTSPGHWLRSSLSEGHRWTRQGQQERDNPQINVQQTVFCVGSC